MGGKPRLSERVRERAAALGLTPAQIAALEKDLAKTAQSVPLSGTSAEAEEADLRVRAAFRDTAVYGGRKAKTALPADRFGFGASAVEGVPLPETEEARMIRALVAARFSKNAIARLLGGSKETAYKRINRALGKPA